MNTSFVHNAGLTPGTTYYYRVCAFDYADNLSSGATADGIPGLSAVRILRIGEEYMTIWGAYHSQQLQQDDVIQTRATDLLESPDFDLSFRVVLEGGYNPTYSARTSMTYVFGTLTISAGTVTIDQIVLR